MQKSQRRLTLVAHSKQPLLFRLALHLRDCLPNLGPQQKYLERLLSGWRYLLAPALTPLCFPKSERGIWTHTTHACPEYQRKVPQANRQLALNCGSGAVPFSSIQNQQGPFAGVSLHFVCQPIVPGLRRMAHIVIGMPWGVTAPPTSEPPGTITVVLVRCLQVIVYFCLSQTSLYEYSMPKSYCAGAMVSNVTSFQPSAPRCVSSV